jgi:peptidyl-prolyl cis-trans isomerase SurA
MDIAMLRQLFAKILLICFTAVVVLPATLRARVVDQLIAVIDGEPYTLRNVEQFAKSKLKADFPTGALIPINERDGEVLEQFITDKLLEAEIRESGIAVTNDDVDQYIEEVKKNNRLSESDFNAALGREGMTLELYKASVKTELSKTELVRRQVRSRVSVTDADVERYYQLNSKKYRSAERARIRHILFSLSENAAPEVVESTLAKAKQVHGRIEAGEDFAALAREFSEGAGRNEGGDIGWVNRGTLIGGLDDAAFEKLAVGEVSEPFRTPMGYHIVKLDARMGGGVQPLTSVAPKIKSELEAKALEERYLKWLKTDLRRKHRVDIKLAGVVFKPEESKEGTMDSLIARSTRTNRRERTFLSYLNPLSYVTSETPLDDLDPQGPLADKNIVSVFGVPLFITERADDVPDVLNPAENSKSAGTGSETNKSGGFFSSVVDTLNPFSSKKP